jgi:hypothetical protein
MVEMATNEIEASEEMRELAQKVMWRTEDAADHIWVFDDKIELEIPLDSRGIWSSDIPDGYNMIDVTPQGDHINVQIA